MNDILYYQNYTIVGDVISFSLCLVCLALFYSSYIKREKNMILFLLATAIMMVSCICSILYHHLLMYSLTQKMVPLIYLLHNLTYIGLIVVLSLFCQYINNNVCSDKTHKRRLSIALGLGGLTFIVVESVSFLTKYGFYIDSNLGIHENYFTDPFRYAYVYHVSCLAYIFVRFRRKFNTKILICLYELMFISVGLVVVEGIFAQTSFLTSTFVMPMAAVLCLFHYNAYDKVTGTLDEKAFDGYVVDLGKNEFHIVSLTLFEMEKIKYSALTDYILHFNEQFYVSPVIFRIGTNRLILVYKESDNPDYEEQTARMLSEFKRLYSIYNCDFKIILSSSFKELKAGKDYLEVIDYVENTLGLNEIHTIEQKDIDGYLKLVYIKQQLEDIDKKCDLNDERVLVYCQPVYDVEHKNYTTAEALMRMKLPEIGMVFPDQFIPLAERYDYIHSLSKIILNKTCLAVKKLIEEGYRIDRVSVNFSISELKGNDFLDDVTRIIMDSGIPEDKIAIELTESRNASDYVLVKDLMEKLQDKGMKFYLDDFGTGYSNFERIVDLPFDIIKFDRSLTITSGKNDESRYLVSSFSNIFKKLNYKILFEGVEDDSDEERCIDMNAMLLQGYKYSKPVPIENLRDFLDKA